MPEYERHKQITQAIRQEMPVDTDRGWIARMPRTQRKILEWMAIAVMVGLIFCQLYLVRRNVLETALATQPPIEFMSEWAPDKEVYHPGDTIRFHYTRTTRLPADEKEPVMALSYDAFENVATGEIYAGSIMGRLISEQGTINRIAVRKIPMEATSGTFVFEGWMQAQTYKRSVPTPYRSHQFQIVAP